MAKSLEIEILDVEFPSRYGGNIRVFLGSKDIHKVNKAINIKQLRKKENSFFEDFQTLNNNINSWINKKTTLINNLIKQNGSIKAKAFPGRAAILVKLLKLDENIVSGVYEKPGSLKIGNYLPGTRIPIFSDEDLISSGDINQPILNLAWHISGEINHYMNSIGYKGKIIDILSEQDFTDD